MMDEPSNQTPKLPRIKAYGTDHVGIFECRYDSALSRETTLDRPTLRLVLQGSYKQTAGLREDTCPILSLLFQPAGVACQQEYEANSYHLVIELRSRIVGFHNLNEIRVPFFLYSAKALELISRLWLNIKHSNPLPRSVEQECQMLAFLIVGEKSKNDTRPAVVEETLKSIHSQFRQMGVKFEKIIQALNRGVCHTTTLFTRYEGIPPGNYRSRLRVEYARLLLLNTRTSLGKISVMVGFGDQSHLTRKFKEIVGTPPREYQQQVFSGIRHKEPSFASITVRPAVPQQTSIHQVPLVLPHPLAKVVPTGSETMIAGRISSFPDPVSR
jgi:AraC-like DNA-binding protein